MTDTPLPDSPTFTMEDVQEQINQALAAQREENDRNLAVMQDNHTKELDSIRASLSGGGPLSPIPAHSGGPGTEIHATWSLAEQTAAREAANAR